jgi:splicing factor 3B subunit 1
MGMCRRTPSMEDEKRRLQSHLRSRNISVWDEEEKTAPINKTSRWEITPRTATQSKRLKWDQTPLGLIRVEDDSVHRSRGAENRWDKSGSSEGLLLKYAEMPLREINLCLPSRGYRKYNLEIGQEEILESLAHTDLPEIKSEERDFFSPIFRGENEAEAMAYRGLLLVKNGDSKMRRHGKRMLVRNKSVDDVLEKLVLLCMSLDLEVAEKTRMVELMKEILEANRGHLGYRRELMFVLASYADSYPLRKTSLECFGLFFDSRVEPLVEVFEEDISSPEIHIREAVSKVFGAYAVHHGFEGAKALLEALSASTRYETRNTCIRTVISICTFLGKSVLQALDSVLELLSGLLLDMDRLIRVDSCNALSVVFNLIKPYRSTRTSSVFFLLRKQALSAHGTEFDAILRSMSFLCIENKDFAEITYRLLKTVGARSSTEIKVFERICGSIDPEEARGYFKGLLPIAFSQNPEASRPFIVSLCVHMCRHSDISQIILRHYGDPRLVNVISEIFSKARDLDLDDVDAAAYYDSLLAALRSGNEVTLRLLEPLVNKKFLRPNFVQTLVQEGMKWFRNPDPTVRTRGLAVVKELSMFMDRKDVVYCGCILFENLSEPDKHVLSFVLRALCSLYNSHRFKGAGEIVPGILPVLKAGDARTSEAAVALLRSVCANASGECHGISSREWLRIAYELVDVLASWSESTRAGTVETLGLISRFVGPQEILNILMDNLQSGDRHQRTGSALGVSIVAEYNGIFSVLPTLLTDYAIPDTNMKYGILKSVLCIYQRVGDKGRDYVHAIIPLIEDALTDDDPMYRNIGLNVVRSVVSSYRAPVIDTEIIVHLLNLMWINVLDYTPQIRLSFDECIEAMSSVLGSDYLHKYVVQGLFHPARRVRERYQDVFRIMQRSDSTALSAFFLAEERPPWAI